MDELKRRFDAVRTSRKWALARLLPVVNRRLTVGVAALVAVTGVLPVAIIVATGSVVGAIPDALGQGLDGPAGRRALGGLVVLGGCFITLQVLSAARAAAGSALGWQLNRHLEERVMVAVAAPTDIAHLEDPASLDRISAARDVVFGGYRPCDAVPALATRLSAWIQGFGAAGVLATYKWWLAVLVFGTWTWRCRVARRWHARGVTTIGVKAPALRRGEYLRDLALTPGAAKEVRVFGLTDWLVGRYREASEAVLEEGARDRRQAQRAGPVSTWATVAVNLLAYVTVGLSAARGGLGLRGLALYASAIAGIQVLAQFGMDNLLLTYGTIPLPAVDDLEAAVADAEHHGTDDVSPAVLDPAAPAQGVTFEGVTFRYPGVDHDALAGLDLVLPAGRSIAIVGANGAGKTTLVKLLCRFYEPDEGRITVDGRPLPTIDRQTWQRRIACVFQDFVRYPVSARDNIAFGAIDFGGAEAGVDEAVEEAARRAGALVTLGALPQRLDTVLAPGYEDGTDLSGGQWQRVVLARALYAAAAGARILVLDEPAANLDARGEAELYDRFLDITRGVTTVIISHRFSTVRRADLIYVIDGGRVIERGSHAELMAAAGAYARMFAVQADRLLGA